MTQELDIKYPVMLVDSGIPDELGFGRKILHESSIPDLSENLRTRASCMLALEWFRECAVIRHDNGSSNYILSTSLGRVITAIQKQVQRLRDETGLYRNPIPLILLSREKPKGFTHTSVLNAKEAIFLGLRLLSGRTDTNDRSAVILSKYANPKQYGQLVEGWQRTRHDIRIESKLPAIIGPLECREFPDVLSIHGKYNELVYIDRDPETEEEIMGELNELFIPRHRRRKNSTGIIKRTHPDDQSVTELLWELIRGRGTYLNIYWESFTGTKNHFHPDLDVPELLGKCLMI